MEWMNRGNRPNSQVSHPEAVAAPASAAGSNSKKAHTHGMLRWASVGLLFSATILTVAVLIFISVGDKSDVQQKFVDKSKMQAVFLNGGQVYFGNIRSLNDKYVRMGNIYYLRVNQQVQPNGQTQNNNDISLVKLGCELHGPQDEMVINQSQVIFWENLKSDGQVAKAVAEYVKQNPNGQQCNTNSTSSTQTDSNAASSSTNSSTNSSTGNSTKKP